MLTFELRYSVIFEAIRNEHFNATVDAGPAGLLSAEHVRNVARMRHQMGFPADLTSKTCHSPSGTYLTR
jgi:hypothetical protein